MEEWSSEQGRVFPPHSGSLEEELQERRQEGGKPTEGRGALPLRALSPLILPAAGRGETQCLVLQTGREAHRGPTATNRVKPDGLGPFSPTLALGTSGSPSPSLRPEPHLSEVLCPGFGPLEGRRWERGSRSVHGGDRRLRRQPPSQGQAGSCL